MIRLEVLDDPETAGARAAELVAEAIRETSAGGPRSWAVSGGSGLAPMLRRLDDLGLPWSRIHTWQVDERIAPVGDPARNRTAQERDLPADALAGVRWMPVEDEDGERAVDRYAATLPDRLDVVHLGVGADGHTASLVPGDPVLEVRDRDVALTTEPYEGLRRMTLTYPALGRCDRAVWFVTGADKREAVERLLDGDRTIPAARVEIDDQVLVTDRAAAPSSGAGRDAG
ncbi:MAG TPA: 6-phosphogluconolactonase [Actinomycetota bacterium]|nr:6-phosphogluconolactonase [Actinomycetota bacterium]